MSRTLDPETAGWTPLSALTPARFITLALLVGLPFTLAFAFVVVDRPGGLRGLLRNDPLPAGLLALAVVVSVPIHEAIHAVAYGQGLRTPRLVIGFCPQGSYPYVLYDGPLPRGTVIRMLAAPFVALSIVPLLALPLMDGTGRGLLAAFCSLHAAMCGGDAVVVWRLLARVPWAALVHIHGGRAFWQAHAGRGSDAEPGAAADGGDM